MDELDGGVATKAEWRERNRGLMLALTACLALWVFAIWLVVHH
jgi:hypothetical protein